MQKVSEKVLSNVLSSVEKGSEVSFLCTEVLSQSDPLIKTENIDQDWSMICRWNWYDVINERCLRCWKQQQEYQTRCDSKYNITSSVTMPFACKFGWSKQHIIDQFLINWSMDYKNNLVSKLLYNRNHGVKLKDRVWFFLRIFCCSKFTHEFKDL